MKKLLNILTAMLLAFFSTSCLTSNLDDLEEFEDANITGIQGCYWRYYGSETHPGSQDVEIKQVRIASGNWTITKESETNPEANFDIQFSQNFPKAERPKFNTNQLVVVFNISQGAVIKPIEGSATLGVPGDWSKPNKYEVTAANGTKKIWTVSLDEIFNKDILSDY